MGDRPRAKHNFQKILSKLESREPKTRSSAARELMQQLTAVYGSRSKIASILGVSTPTVYRWLQAKFAPRDLLRIKAALGNSALADGLNLSLSAGAAAGNSGVHSIDFFFERAALARDIFKFKSFLEFQIGESKQIQRRMQELLEQNDELRMYYVFPAGSKADETFTRFYELLTAIDEPWTSRIYKCPVRDEMLALGLGYTGVIVLEYLDSGCKSFGRSVDILLEAPIRVYENGEPNAFVKQSIWIELPTDASYSLWTQWKSFLQ